MDSAPYEPDVVLAKPKRNESNACYPGRSPVTEEADTDGGGGGGGGGDAVASDASEHSMATVTGVRYFLVEDYRAMATAPHAFILLLFDGYQCSPSASASASAMAQSRVGLVQRSGTAYTMSILTPYSDNHQRYHAIPPCVPVLRVPTTLENFNIHHRHELVAICESRKFVRCTSSTCCVSRVDDRTDTFTVHNFEAAAAQHGYFVIPNRAFMVILKESREGPFAFTRGMWIWRDGGQWEWKWVICGPLPHHDDHDCQVILTRYTPPTLEFHTILDGDIPNQFMQEVFRVADAAIKDGAVLRWGDVMTTAPRLVDAPTSI